MRAMVCLPLGALLALSLLPACRPLAKIHNVQNAVVPVEAETDRAVGEAILRGCQRRGWQATEVAPGTIDAEYRTGKIMAAVSIRYDRTHYSILYRDSDGMNYNERRQGIHHRYTLWIKNLDRALKDELARLDAR